MKKHIYDEINGLHYTLHGDVYLPDLTYSKNDYPPLDKYGMLRKTYLQEHHKALFSKMLLRDELWPHLLEVDEQSHEMMDSRKRSWAFRIVSHQVVFQENRLYLQDVPP